MIDMFEVKPLDQSICHGTGVENPDVEIIRISQAQSAGDCPQRTAGRIRKLAHHQHRRGRWTLLRRHDFRHGAVSHRHEKADHCARKKRGARHQGDQPLAVRQEC